MSFEVRFGFGELVQGEPVVSPELDRLLAKKAWLVLHSYLMRNDEPLQASNMPVPFSLEEDGDVLSSVEKTKERIRYLCDRDEIIKKQDDQFKDPVFREHVKRRLRGILDGTATTVRHNWVKDRVMSFNPRSVFEVGGGYGELAVMIAGMDISVDCLTPSIVATEPAGELTDELNLPINFLTGFFESFFSGSDTPTHDVVCLCEILEHVLNPSEFIYHALRFAKKGVIITVPEGPVEFGFNGKYQWQDANEHIRVYTAKSFSKDYFKSIDVDKVIDHSKIVVERVAQSANRHGVPIQNLCVVLRKKEPS